MSDDLTDMLGEEPTTELQMETPKGWVPPDELVEYLRLLISTPDEKALYIPDLRHVDWALVTTWADASLCGLITRGTPTEAQSKELLRILKPGAHLLLIAPEEERWGATGACAVEDIGFEIRDAILIADPPPAGTENPPCHFHYTPKSDRGERELGCHNLEGKSGAEAVGREEGAAGTANGRAGAGHSAKKIKNFHPTVKPVELMVKLLADVPHGPDVSTIPADAKPSDVIDPFQVLDPFLGSGSTGLACMETQHSFRGMERERDYVKIATSRSLQWKNQLGKKGKDGDGRIGMRLGDDFRDIRILSDVMEEVAPSKPKEEEPEVDLDTLFGID